ncbi:unnamed protein product [Knipowitschia caucasica]|uniref:Transmembrane protein FAM155A n=1 Tax=Knipowitschia caucasica TaxID=637954 RepID=A0AAV2LAF5_KNICA
MSPGTGTCWQHDDDLVWIEPQQPLTDRFRVSWASLLLLALLSDHLWFRADAKLLSSSSASAASAAPLPDRVRPVFVNSTRSFTLADAEHLCGNLSVRSRGGSWDTGAHVDESAMHAHLHALHLSFCSSYSLMDLLRSGSSPDRLRCSLHALHERSTCSACVSAFQRYDLHALEKYEDFEQLALKYEPGPYSVRTCMDQCKMAYKWWLCAQFFPDTSPSCGEADPCGHSCLRVQQSCPFILPDNEDLIHGGSPSFICTGLLSDLDVHSRCCDVRWSPAGPPSLGTARRTAPPPCDMQREWLSSSSSRLRLCCPLLVLALLHTVLLFSHNATLRWEEGGANDD